MSDENHVFVTRISNEHIPKMRPDARLSVTFEFIRKADNKVMQMSLGGLGVHVFTKMEELLTEHSVREQQSGVWMYRVRIVDVVD